MDFFLEAVRLEKASRGYIQYDKVLQSVSWYFNYNPI